MTDNAAQSITYCITRQCRSSGKLVHCYSKALQDYTTAGCNDLAVSRQQESGFTTSSLLLNLICFYQQKLIELLLELAICVGIPVGVAILCAYIFWFKNCYLTKGKRLYCSRRPLSNSWRVWMYLCRRFFRTEHNPYRFVDSDPAIHFSCILWA